MIDDRVTTLLADASHAPLPARLKGMHDAVMIRAGEIDAERRRTATMRGGVAVAAFAMLVGVFGSLVPAQPAAATSAYDPGLALAPSTLLGARR